MDDELSEARRAQLAVPPMPEYQPAEVRELPDREVSSQGSLTSLAPLDADADVRRVDHAHVVPAVSNGGCACLGVLADELDDFGLLCRRASTADHRRRSARHLIKASGALQTSFRRQSTSVEGTRQREWIRQRARGCRRVQGRAGCGASMLQLRQRTRRRAVASTSMKSRCWCSTHS